MKKTAFTLVELLIVIAIISILSASSIVYFNNYTDSLKIQTRLSYIYTYFEELDNEVKNKQIYDYELHLNTWSLLFYVYKNNIDNLWRVYFDSFDVLWWTWVLKTSLTEPSQWQFKFYNDYKFIEENYLSATWTTSLNFEKFANYKILSYLSWSRVNDIFINYYDKSNLEKTKNDLLYLQEINTKKDLTWINYNSIIIKNILWKKEFYSWATLINTDEIYLFFDNYWNRDFIKITK